MPDRLHLSNGSTEVVAQSDSMEQEQFVKLERCRVCGGRCPEEMIAYGAIYDRCNECGTLQKRLTAQQFASLDVTYDAGECLDDAAAPDVERFLDVDEKVLQLRSSAADAVARGGRFLDIGCGMGGFLLAARRLGFEAVGVEPSADHAHVARDVLGFKVIDGCFDPDAVPGKFDLVVLSHVIEHIYRPKTFLDGVRSVLAPGGTLLIFTPNADSFVARSLGARWPMLATSDHVTMLGPRSVEQMLAGADYNLFTSEYPHEFAAAWAAQIWRRLSGRGHSQPAENISTLPRASRRPLLKEALRIASYPFHLYAKASGRGACLVATVRR